MLRSRSRPAGQGLGAPGWGSPGLGSGLSRASDVRRSVEWRPVSGECLGCWFGVRWVRSDAVGAGLLELCWITSGSRSGSLDATRCVRVGRAGDLGWLAGGRAGSGGAGSGAAGVGVGCLVARGWMTGATVTAGQRGQGWGRGWTRGHLKRGGCERGDASGVVRPGCCWSMERGLPSCSAGAEGPAGATGAADATP